MADRDFAVRTTCPACGHDHLNENLQWQSFPFGSENTVELKAEVPVLSCEACGFEFMDARAEECRRLAACDYQQQGEFNG